MPVYTDSDNRDYNPDYTDLMQDAAFIGEYPFDSILDGITNQFENYISTEDRTDYVDIFYNQWRDSVEESMQDYEDHPQEKKEILFKNYNTFIDTIHHLFQRRLNMNITVLDEETPIDEDDLEILIRRLYEFFVLQARKNFKLILAKKILPKLKKIKEKDLVSQVQDLLEDYNPIITSVVPMDFLKLGKAEEIADLFEEGMVTGNFMKKYSPKLYINDDLEMDIINYIVMVYELRSEILGGKDNGTD